MARKKEAPVQEEEKKASPVLAPLRKVLLASIGAVAVAQDEAELLISKLVESNEIARNEVQVNDVHGAQIMQRLPGPAVASRPAIADSE